MLLALALLGELCNQAAVKSVFLTVSDVISLPSHKSSFSFYRTGDLSYDYRDDYN